MAEPATYRDLTVYEVKAALDRGDAVRLIDVREEYEHQIARIEGAELLPLSRAGEWAPTLHPDENLVFFCHAGVRSAHVAAYLSARRGFSQVANMLGGIDEWSIRIDQGIPRY